MGTCTHKSPLSGKMEEEWLEEEEEKEKEGGRERERGRKRKRKREEEKEKKGGRKGKKWLTVTAEVQRGVSGVTTL